MKYINFNTIFLLIVGIAFYTLNVFTPLMHDDIAYLYKYGPVTDLRPTDQPINNITDVFESQYYHYMDVNGRAVIHTLLQSTLLVGKWLFDIINSLVFIGLIVLIYKYVKPKKITNTENITLLTFIVASLWLTAPFIGQTMLWMSGACNYLWGSFIVLLFLYYLQNKSYTKHNSYAYYAFIFCGSTLAGWTQESLTIGVSAAILLYYIFNKHLINRRNAIMILGFWLGTLLIIISPGTFNRINSEVPFYGNNFIYLIIDRIVTLVNILVIIKFQLLILVSLITIAYFKKIPVKDILKQRLIFILATVICILIIAVLGKPEDRILFGVSILICLINSDLFIQIIQSCSKLIIVTISVILISLLTIDLSKAVIICNKYDKYYSSVVNKIKTTEVGIISVVPFENSKYVYNTIRKISDCNNFHNRVRSFYFNVNSITILPSNIYDKLIPNNTICVAQNMDTTWAPHIYHDNAIILYEIPNKNIVRNAIISGEFNYKKSGDNNLKPHQQIIRKALRTLNIMYKSVYGYYIELNNKHYILFDINDIDMDNVQSICIESNVKSQKKLIFNIKKK